MYFHHLRELQEMAFIRWRKSNYKDFDAHDEYIKYYNLAQKILISKNFLLY